MKLSLLIYLLIIPQFLHAQTALDSFNNVDSLGQKQGYWIEKVIKVKLIRFEIVTSKKYLDEITEYRFFKMAEGNYLNSQKVGQWQYYSDCINNFEIRKEINLGTLLIGSRDTSLLLGEIYQDADTLLLTCENRKCVVKSLNNVEIVSFAQNTLDKELENFSRCKYSRLIRRKINNQ